MPLKRVRPKRFDPPLTTSVVGRGLVFCWLGKDTGAWRCRKTEGTMSFGQARLTAELLISEQDPEGNSGGVI